MTDSDGLWQRVWLTYKLDETIHFEEIMVFNSITFELFAPSAEVASGSAPVLQTWQRRSLWANFMGWQNAGLLLQFLKIPL